MFAAWRVALIIPALNEEAAIGPLLDAVDRRVVDRVIVADNGSEDQTARRAAAGGAEVIAEPRRGYGRACLAAIRRCRDADVLVFMDGDGSDDPAEIPRLLSELQTRPADLVLGSRVTGAREPGALTAMQKAGNALTCLLIRLFWGVRYTDLGPFRAIRREALERLDMREPAYGWTVEMQVKAAQRGLRVSELPVTRRVRQGGRSKVSGNLSASLRAGRRILGFVLAAKARELRNRGPLRSP
ncbi:MAG: glycosyltransferase [Candidatus Eisenbacteria bacterium]|nr:glycosyltransferase [Candidatus Eisenbacteria bacterium]